MPLSEISEPESTNSKPKVTPLSPPDGVTSPKSLSQSELNGPMTSEKKAYFDEFTSVRIDSKYIEDLSNLYYFTNLVHLEIELRSLVLFPDLSHLTKFKSLSIVYDYGDSLTVIGQLTRLESLKVLKTTGTLPDLAQINSLTNLVSLDLSGNHITDFTPLSGFGLLTHLNLSNTELSDLSPISSLNNLQYLCLSNNFITDINPLSMLNNLNEIVLTNNTVSDIKPLEPLKTLRLLKLAYNLITDINPLFSLPGLYGVILDGNPLDDHSAYEIIPSLQVDGIVVYWGVPVECEKIIQLLLTHKYIDGGYDVIMPKMCLGYPGGISAMTSWGGGVESINSIFQEEGYDLSLMLETLFERNIDPIRMNIASSSRDGYIIDYDHKFMDCFSNKLGMDGWTLMRILNPRAHAIVTISMPVYDPITEIVLVYIGWQSAPLTGEGRIHAFKYQNQKLEELASVGLWIS